MQRSVFSRFAARSGLLLAAGLAQAADKPKEVRLDYAYYSPPSLVRPGTDVPAVIDALVEPSFARSVAQDAETTQAANAGR